MKNPFHCLLYQGTTGPLDSDESTLPLPEKATKALGLSNVLATSGTSTSLSFESFFWLLVYSIDGSIVDSIDGSIDGSIVDYFSGTRNSRSMSVSMSVALGLGSNSTVSSANVLSRWSTQMICPC